MKPARLALRVPALVRVVAGLLVLQGIWAVVEMGSRLVAGQLHLNISVIAFVLAWSLLRLRETARLLTLIYLWLSGPAALIGSALILAGWDLPLNFYATVFLIPVQEASAWLLVVGWGLSLALLAFSTWVLASGSTRESFRAVPG